MLVCAICFIDWVTRRREGVIVALRPLLDEARLLDPEALRAASVRPAQKDVIAIVGFGTGNDEAEFNVVRALRERCCTILAYGSGWDHAPLSRRCRALLAGAGPVLDSDAPGFDTELRRRLAAAIRETEHRSEEETRLRAAMTQVGIIGRSTVMLALGRWLQRIAPLSDLPVLITGETGTGKELIARAVHELDPKRRRGPFVALNCAALTASLAESELFGHRKGAFTGASHDRRGLIRAAHGGTLFLDEVGELELGIQAKLLRVIQEGCVRAVGDEHENPVSVRIVAATNRELPHLVDQGRFRPDLYFRLNLLATRAPTLAERGSDVEVLVDHFLQKYGGGRALRAMPSLLGALQSLELPGNVRQLEHLMRHAVVHAREDGTIGLEELPASVWDQLASASPSSAGDPAAPGQDWAAVLDANAWNLSQSLLSCERHFLKAALTRTQGNRSAVARLLGVTPRSIYSKIRKHHLAR
jgi:transcriptional regulator with GAF, ATPase, and Fis domain